MTDIATERATMSIPEILDILKFHTGRFPRQAVRDAIEQREAITPELVGVLEDVAHDPGAFAEREKYMLHLYAMYLLAQFREQRAYRPLVEIVSAPDDIADALAGDTITDGLPQIFCSVYDGDPEPLRRLVEDENVDEYVRSAALEAFLLLVVSDQMPREEAISYYRSLFEERLARKPNHVWNTLVCNVGDSPAPELMDHVRRAYADGLVDTGFTRLEEIERNLSAPQNRRKVLISDAIAEMEWWAGFQPKAVSKALPLARKPAPPPARQTKVGRNTLALAIAGESSRNAAGQTEGVDRREARRATLRPSPLA